MWSEVGNFVSNPDIILVFHGLMALCERSNPKQFEFGCFGENEGKKHDLKISVGYVDPADNFVVSNCIPVSAKEIFDFKVEGATGTPIGVYKPAGTDNKSFAHGVDIEEKYRQRVSKQRPNFSNFIRVHNGLLYTKALTTSKFNLRNGERSRVLAAQLAINIRLNPGESGVLTTSAGTRIPPFTKQNDPHVIYFNNDCEENGGKCKWYPTSDYKEKRNDFYLHYRNVIDGNLIGGVEYELKRVTTGGNDLQSTHKPIIPTPFQYKGKVKIFESNKAPCHATGYGDTDGWTYS
jgi:hypothetical protein